MKEKHQPTEDMKTADAPNPVADVSNSNDSNSEVVIPPKNVSDTIEMISVEELKPDENQPRKYFNEAETKELADSIKFIGIITPLLYKDVNGKKIIVSGERRIRAAREARLEKVPCRKVIDDADLIGLKDNMDRKNLLPMEEALAVDKLKKDKGYTQAKLGEKLGKSQNTISEILSLAKLPEYIQTEVLYNPKWSRAKLLELTKIKDKDEQKNEFEKIKEDFAQTPSLSENSNPEIETKETTTENPGPEKDKGSPRTFKASIKNTRTLHKQLEAISKFNQTRIESIPEDEKNGFKEELKQLKRAIEKCIKNFSD